jgi:hypothetical protein
MVIMYRKNNPPADAWLPNLGWAEAVLYSARVDLRCLSNAKDSCSAARRITPFDEIEHGPEIVSGVDYGRQKKVS